MLRYIKERARRKQAAQALYEAAAAQALKAHFYSQWQVPDTFDGRFEMLMLHSFLVWRRIREEGPQAAWLSQAFFDALFVQMDRTLRERGVGDLGVPRHVKTMMRAFKGRALAYDVALSPGAAPDALRKALIRNVYGTVSPPREDSLERLCNYICRCESALKAQPRIIFPDPQDIDDGKKEERKKVRSADAGMAA